MRFGSVIWNTKDVLSETSSVAMLVVGSMGLQVVRVADILKYLPMADETFTAAFQPPMLRTALISDNVLQ